MSPLALLDRLDRRLPLLTGGARNMPVRIERYGARSKRGRRVWSFSASTVTRSRADVIRTVPAAFTASETFDVGVDLGSPVPLEHAQRRPFAFNSEIDSIGVVLK
jgi:hypothetical protein